MIVTPNSEIVQNASKDEELRSLIASADLIIPDGIGLVYASKVMGCPLSERVTGIDFLEVSSPVWRRPANRSFLRKQAGRGRRSGGQDEEEISGTQSCRYAERLFSAGGRGSHRKADQRGGADFLCVALGAPKQERFIAQHRDEFTSVRGAIGVGGSLDVWAGNLKRAPEFYRNHGLEWLYRFIQQPTRFKRMLTLPVFMLRVIFRRGR